METNNRDTAPNAAPSIEWLEAENRPKLLCAARPDEDEDENDDEEDDNTGDWGHIDPAEGNGPFPDPNAPSAPGSAV